MSKIVLNKKLTVKGKVINIGIDVHKSSWRITALVEGEIILAVTISNPNHSKLKTILDRLQENTIRVCIGRFLLCVNNNILS